MDGLFNDFYEEIHLLKRHLDVLKIVAKNQPIGIISLSRKLNLTPAQTRYSLRVLQQKGLITPSVLGATTPLDLRTFNFRIKENKKKLMEEVDKL